MWPKFIQRTYLTSFPYLLRFNMKHYPAFYLIENEVDLKAAALEMLKHNLEWGCYYIDNEVPATFPEYFQSKYGVTLTEFQNLPKKLLDQVIAANFNSSMSVDQSIAYVEKRFKEATEANKEALAVEKALHELDGVAAFTILHSRSNKGYEYETFTQFYLENRERT